MRSFDFAKASRTDIVLSAAAPAIGVTWTTTPDRSMSDFAP